MFKISNKRKIIISTQKMFTLCPFWLANITKSDHPINFTPISPTQLERSHSKSSRSPVQCRFQLRFVLLSWQCCFPRAVKKSIQSKQLSEPSLLSAEANLQNAKNPYDFHKFDLINLFPIHIHFSCPLSTPSSPDLNGGICPSMVERQRTRNSGNPLEMLREMKLWKLWKCVLCQASGSDQKSKLGGSGRPSLRQIGQYGNDANALLFIVIFMLK